MEKILGKLRMFCYAVSFSPNPFTPYPLFSGHVVMFDHGKDIVQITEENYLEVVERVYKMVAGFTEKRDTVKDKVMEILIIMSSPYRLQFLRLIDDDISKDDLAEFLSWVWTQTEYPHTYPLEMLLELFDQVDRKKLMEAEEYKEYLALPDTLTVYRGTQSHKAKVRGMSWTLDKDKATWFANRWKTLNGKVYQATIKKKDVYAYFTGRNEKEVVLNPKKLKGVKEV